MNKKIVWKGLLLCLCSLSACDGTQNAIPAEIDAYSSQEQAITNGTKVTGRDRYSTVGLMIDYGENYEGYHTNRYYTACSGTLISPQYVLTAAHCMSNCPNAPAYKDFAPYMRIGFGQDERELTDIYEIESFIPHPDFKCNMKDPADLGLIKLKTAVPSSVTIPTLPLPPELALTAAEVDSDEGINAITVGLGVTIKSDPNSFGTKYETTRKAYAVCSLSGDKSKGCNSISARDGAILFSSTQSSTLGGDSGGPTLIMRDGIEYVAGVTSIFSGNYNVETNVSDFYDFITQYTGELKPVVPENCSDEKDDNGNGLIDCDDPYCFNEKHCIREDCANKIDDDGNGFADCDDPACKDAATCQPEICDDKIDNNENGLVDCKDPDCADALNCQPEICDDEIDNNGDGLIDCNDPKCAYDVKCQKEDCNNHQDDNGNGLIDCQDPECTDALICQPEICNDKIDNNGNGLIDCDEFSCKTQPYCQPENCSNGIDDNQDGLADCLDPQCFGVLTCLPEICDDEIDNNGNGLIDCDEESCQSACNSSESGCSFTSGTRPSGIWMLLLGLFTLFGLRKRENR